MAAAAAPPAPAAPADVSLDDMMAALHRADSSGNAVDAGHIAAMIQKAYPDHTKAMLNMTPPSIPFPQGTSAPIDPMAGMRSMMTPQPAPITAPPVPLYGTPQGTQPAQSSQTAPQGGGGGGNVLAPAGVAPTQPAGYDWTTDNAPMAMLRNWVGSMPGGNWLAAGMRAGLDTAGLASGPGFSGISQIHDAINASQAQATSGSPIAALAGNAVGNSISVATAGGALGAGAKALGAAGVPLISPMARAVDAAAKVLGTPGGTPVATAGKLVAAGAAGGAGSAAIDDIAAGHAPSLSNAAVGAAVGAVAGPIISNTVESTWGFLAKKINDTPALSDLFKGAKVDPAELQKTADAIKAANGGRPPTLAEILPAQVRANTAKLAGDNPDIGNMLAGAKAGLDADSKTQVPAMLADASKTTPAAASPTGSAGVQRLGDLEAARDAKMTDLMRGGPTPLADQRVVLQPGDDLALSHPSVVSSLRPNPAAQDEIGRAIDDLGNGRQASVSIDTLDRLRQSVARRAGSADPEVADAGKQAFNGVMDIAGRSQGYKAALDQNAQHNAFIEGFQKGQSGNAIADTPGATRLANNAKTGDAFKAGHGSGVVSGLADQATASPAAAKTVLGKLVNDDSLNASIAAAHGQPAADALRGAAKTLQDKIGALGDIAPGGPVGDKESKTLAEGMQRAGLAAVFHHPMAMLYQLVDAAKSSVSGGLSPSVVKAIGDKLVDPNGAQQAIEFLRARGVSEPNLARIRAFATAYAGGLASHESGLAQ